MIKGIKAAVKTGLLERRKSIFFTLLGISIAGIILSSPAFLRLVEFLGHRIPQKDIRLDYIKGMGWAIFLAFTIFVWPVSPSDKKALLWIWSVKCFIMLFIMLFYEYHYKTDAFSFFSGARYDMSKWKSNYLAGPSLPVVFISWLHQHFLLDSFHATKVTFGMIGLLAIYIFYRAVTVFIGRGKIGLLYMLAFFPSLLFWSSTLAKEPLLLLGIAIYSYGFIKWFVKKSSVYFFIMLAGIMIVAYIRVWMGPILVMPVFIIALTVTLKNIRAKAAILFIILILSLLFYSCLTLKALDLKPGNNLSAVLVKGFHYHSRGGSAIVENKIRGTSLKDIILFVPQGIFTVLFRPLPGDVNNVFGFLAGLEGAFLLILLGLAVKRARWSELANPVCIWAILLIAIWAAFYAFVGYNMGTICRYRVQVLPVFLGLLLYMTSRKTA